MSILKAGLIGEHISRTRLPLALEIMCDLHGRRRGNFRSFARNLGARRWHFKPRL